ncbi:hypothetical protein LTR53_013625 [Teratosphaeriaceae sp. CCFEE 6253]|nr:hypothetical protein LTR53_013625 [Teratosphaeriaceae sp. CCFEE 6253]
MPPVRAKKARVSTTHTDAITALPAAVTLPTETDEDAHTPENSPAKRSADITQAQKQALVDNLQLEITERARKLRAQYALQAQGLRTRLEMRVNRIPQALRQRNMQDLLDEHTEKSRPAPAPPVPAKDDAVQQSSAQVTRSPARKSLKRQSDHISTSDDKENAPASPAGVDLPNPKKRAKTTTTATANTKATRTVSRKGIAPPSSVLSPKSHNSRTLPRSPFRSPEKPTAFQARPTSPVKPSIQHLAPPKAVGRAPSRQQAKRPVTAMATAMDEEMAEGRSSEASIASAGTTIVTKPAASRGRAGVKKAAASAIATAKTVGRPKAAAVKKENVPPVPAATGGRTLRKRG